MFDFRFSQLELRQNFRYAWMMRLRTDLVYYADVPPLSATHALVSASGMTADPLYRCMNDQVLICPRHLCRPYFRLLELWSSPHCNATAAQEPSIFASTLEPHGMRGPPDAPFRMPLPPPEQRRKHMSAQWYFFARYSIRAGAPACKPREPTARCCGPFLREFAWPYSIARGRSSLECQFRLAEYPARKPSDLDAAHRPSFFANLSSHLLACRQMQIEWRRHGKRSKQQQAGARKQGRLGAGAT